MVVLFDRRQAPRRASALLPLPVLGDDGGVLILEIAALLLILGLIAAIVAAVRTGRALGRARIELAAAEQRAGLVEGALAASAGGFWSWRVGAPPEDPGTGGPALAALLDVGEGELDEFDAVLRALRPEDGAALDDRTAALRRNGTSFTLDVATAEGARTLEVRGQRGADDHGGEAGGFDTVWFRDVTETTARTAELAARADALATRAAGHRGAMDRIGIPVWVRGEGFELVYCNQAFAEAVDQPDPDAALASGAEIAGGPTGWGRELANEAAASGWPVTRSAHVVSGGERRYMEITELPIDGGGWRILGFALDRTDVEEARDELARHIDAHGEVLERLGTGIVIYGPDTRLQFSNTAFARMWGLDTNWLATLPTHGEILEDLRARRVHPDLTDFQAFKREVMELYTSLIEPREELLHLPDERAFRTVMYPHPMGGLLITFEDVTDRLTLERSYNTLIAVQSETLNNLHEGVVVFGSDGRVRLFNPSYARIWNLDPRTLRGEPRLADIIEEMRGFFKFEGEWEPFRDRILAGITDRTPRGGRFERNDGSVIDYAAVPLPDGAMMFSYIDVTDSIAVQRALSERNEALLAADRLKSEFITNVSYELRTPLNTIIGFTELLADQYFGELNERQASYTRHILEASQILLSLIDNILDLALIDAGRLELDRRDVDIRVMMDEVIKLTETHKRTAVVELDCPDDIGSLKGDERRLKQVLWNLLTNAMAHTPPEGRICLSARQEGNGTLFTIADTGPGIAEEDQARILGRFETTQSGGERGAGLGLGLALVKSFVELHGGRLTLESCPGEGTTVSFTIPDGDGSGPGVSPGTGTETGATP